MHKSYAKIKFFKNIKLVKFFFIFYIYTKNILQIFFLDIKILNMYYQKQKEKLRKEARENYQNFSGEEKDKRRRQISKSSQITKAETT